MAGEIGGIPDGTPLTDERRHPTLDWSNLFTRWAATINALRQSGTTAQRPTAGLWVGRTYFDIDLGTPIWVQSVNPAVWVDSTGTPA
jgi:hypothetical protein